MWYNRTDMKLRKTIPTDQRTAHIGTRSASIHVSPHLNAFRAHAVEYLKHRKPRLSVESYVREDRIVTVSLASFFGEETELSSISRLDVQKYVAHRSGDVSPASITKELNVLKRLLSQAVEWKLIPANPAYGIKAPPVPVGRLRHISPIELRRVLNSCPEWLKPIVDLAVATGMTRSELLELRWRDVDVEASAIAVPQTKLSQRRLVPLNAVAQQALASVRREKSKLTDLVFAGPSVTKLNVSQAFRRACQSAGISHFSFQDIRHTAASWLV